MTEPCSNVSNQLVYFADGELAGEEHRHVAEHIAACPACRGELRQLERSLDLARAEWRCAAQPTPHRAEPRHWPAVAARAAACIACLLIAAAVLLRRTSHPVRPQVAIHSDAIAAKPMSDAEITDYIEREARAARLAVSAKLLASQPGLENYAASAERYLEKVNPGN